MTRARAKSSPAAGSKSPAPAPRDPTTPGPKPKPIEHQWSGVSFTMHPRLHDLIIAAAKLHGVSISAWLRGAAVLRLRREGFADHLPSPRPAPPAPGSSDPDDDTGAGGAGGLVVG